MQHQEHFAIPKTRVIRRDCQNCVRNAQRLVFDWQCSKCFSHNVCFVYFSVARCHCRTTCQGFLPELSRVADDCSLSRLMFARDICNWSEIIVTFLFPRPNELTAIVWLDCFPVQMYYVHFRNDLKHSSFWASYLCKMACCVQCQLCPARHVCFVPCLPQPLRGD